jgi:hypothetical protein
MNSSKIDSLILENPSKKPISNNVDEIAAHLNQSIATEGLIFEASLDEQILKITVKTEQLLEGDTLSKSVRDELLKLKLTNIESVQLYKQKIRKNNCYKLNEFTIIPGADAAVEPVKEILQSQTQPTTESHIHQLGSQESSAQRARSNRLDDQKPKQKINQARQIGLLVLFIALAIFGIWLTITRLSRWLFSPFGLIGAVFGLPLLFKYYRMLFKLWKTLTQEKDN